MLSIATVLDCKIRQIDVKTDFLNGNLEEDINMQQSEVLVFEGQVHMVPSFFF